MQNALIEAQRIFDVAPFIADLGCKLEKLESGICHASIELTEKHQQQDGFVHAGVQATLADHCAGTAAVTLIDDHQMVLTAEFKINLLRAAKGKRLLCKSAVLKAGRVLTVAESEVFAEDENKKQRLVAKATVTLAVMDKPKVEGQ
jgi:uncharacterized protein (TIGR00369 family)